MSKNAAVSTTAESFEVLTKDLIKQIDSIIKNNNNNSSRLVNILLEIQDIIPKHYIPTEVAVYVSEELDLPISQVYDVISFYAALSPMRRADYIIQICDSVVCNVVGNSELKKSIEKIIGVKIGEITQDEKFALEFTPCFGACDISPAMRVNGKVYGHLTSFEKVKEIISTCI